jgi:hypothetical protein
MTHESATRPAPGDVKSPLADEPWCATFSFLDFSSTISSSQVRRLLAFVTRLWRR